MPVLQQLSIFLENKPGVLARLCHSLAAEKINIQGITISDTVDHAVVRLILSDTAKARLLLESHGVLVVETDVLALNLEDQPGKLADVAHKLAKAKINIEYAYGTAASGNMLILRVSDLPKARKVLKA